MEGAGSASCCTTRCSCSRGISSTRLRGAVAVVELVLDDVVPAVAAGAGRAGQGEGIGAAGDAPEVAAALDRRGADLLIGEKAEQLAKAGDLFLVDSVWKASGVTSRPVTPVPPVEITTSMAGIGDPGLWSWAMIGVFIVAHDRWRLATLWPSRVDHLDPGPGRICRRSRGARVRDGQNGDVDREGKAAFRQCGAW